jgi:ubiquitin-protein ligase/uncharacterized protein YegL
LRRQEEKDPAGRMLENEVRKLGESQLQELWKILESKNLRATLIHPESSYLIKSYNQTTKSKQRNRARMKVTQNEEQEETSSAPVPIPVIDIAWLSSLFPSKDSLKITAWVKTLHDNEFETLSDLANLDDAGWESLDLPKAIIAGMKKSMKESTTTPTTAVLQSPSALALIDQVDCVVMDISGSMKSKSHIDRDKTREDLSKILFHSMMDKLVSLELSHAVGLLAFGSNVTPIAITREYERFHDELGRLDAREGSTKLYDAILSAAEMIEAFVTANAAQIDHAQLKKRVFVLTDGEDNASNQQPFVVAQYLQEHNVLLDAIPVAGSNAILHALTAASSGLCFDVENEEQGMALFESEATLHVGSREVMADPSLIPRITDRASFQALIESSKQSCKAPVREVRVAVPQTVFSPVLSAAAAARVCSGSAELAATISKRSAGVTRRIMSEYSKLMTDETLKAELALFCTVDMNADDISQWKVWFRDLPDPYVGGTWLLTVNFPETYPFVPPKMRFATPLYHCNVNSSGALCIDVLKENWNPGLTVAAVLKTIYAVLLNPDVDNPLDAFKAQLLKDNKPEYLRLARLHTASNAADSMEVMMARFSVA